MLYSTIVQRDETGLNMIYDAAREFEQENVLEAIVSCRFDYNKVQQTLFLVREYQQRLNRESFQLNIFSENFIESYATDNNKCFTMAAKLLRRIGTTVTGSMKIFRKFCPIVRRQYGVGGRVVPVLDYSRLSFRQFHGQLFGADVYVDLVQTLLLEISAFFHHLLTTLQLCKDMIRREELTRHDYKRLKEIFERSCDEVLLTVRDVKDVFGEVKLVSEEELAERRKNARPMSEWLAKDYHNRDKKWLLREAYILRTNAARQYGLDDEAALLWTKNPEHGKKMDDIIKNLDHLNLPFKRSKKATEQGKLGTFDSRTMLYMVKYSGVSSVNPVDKKVDNEPKERRFYRYVGEKYDGQYILPSWQSVCSERKNLYDQKVSSTWMASQFKQYVSESQQTTPSI